MNYWWTSDYHFSHANIIRYCNRPFETVEEMNETIIRKHNERVKPEDTVFFLGDFIFKGGKEGGGNTDLSKYSVNLGRSSDEIKDMKSRIEDELFGVLTVDERKNFDLDKALKRINKAMENVT